jgi:hypothetical protein
LELLCKEIAKFGRILGQSGDAYVENLQQKHLEILQCNHENILRSRNWVAVEPKARSISSRILLNIRRAFQSGNSFSRCQWQNANTVKSGKGVFSCKKRARIGAKIRNAQR